MKPILRFNSIIIGLTTIVVFFGWLNLKDVINAHPGLGLLAAGLISIGTYRVFFNLLSFLVKHIFWIKQLIFSAYYLEGTWVGYYISQDGRPRFFIEQFEQSIDNMVIRGKSYEQQGEYHGSWIAENPNMNIFTGQLTYQYTANTLINTHINPGLAMFNLERNNSNTPPHMMLGFTSDVYNPNKIRAIEIKISSKTSIDIIEGLKNANELYKKYQNNF